MNSRLRHAVELLEKEKVSCVILTDDKEPILSKEIGIKPLMTELRKNKNAFQHGVIADKVVGKAAALMAVLGGAEEVYGVIMSKSAKEVLQAYKITCFYQELVPYIENRTKTGQCPLEESVSDIDVPEQAFQILENTIQKLMKRKSE